MPQAAPPGGEQAVCAAPPLDNPAAKAPFISQEEGRALLELGAALFVDCRPRPEFLRGHVAGALSLPSDQPEIDDEVQQLLRAASTVITYCDARGGCQSSSRLASRLRELGLSDVRVLEGGMPEWLERGYPAESGTCRLCKDETR